MSNGRFALLACAAAALALPARAAAATFQVTNGDNAGTGSLRAAIQDANDAAGADQITFTGPHVVEAAAALPAITGPTAVDGAGGRIRGSGLQLTGRPVTVTRLGIEPPNGIATSEPAAPSGLTLRRFSDGRLRVSGTLAAAGALDVLRGGGASWLTRIDGLPAGPFAVPLNDVEPGGTLTATLTSTTGTSAFGAPAPMDDLASPVLQAARTVDSDLDGRTDRVRLTLSEPVRDASGLGGLAVGGFSSGTVSTGAGADDAEIDVAVRGEQLAGDATPAVTVASNTALADAAGNQVLAGSGAVTARDTVGPRIARAVGMSRNTVRVEFGEPPASPAEFAPDDFVLEMAGEPRAVAKVALAGDRRALELTSASLWPYGSAGTLTLKRTLTDAAGNATEPGAPATRVWAAPGDTVPPVLSRVRMTPRTVCVRGVSASCRRTGAKVSYTVDEDVTIGLDVRRARSRAVSAIRRAVKAGSGTVSIGAKVEGRRLRPGSYTVTVTATDAAGNAPRPRTLRFRVRH